MDPTLGSEYPRAWQIKIQYTLSHFIFCTKQQLVWKFESRSLELEGKHT
jgi:hypothetical protein